MENREHFRDTSCSVALKIDQICDEFEAGWRAGRATSIEAFVASLKEPDSETLIRELIPLEIECRRRRGESPDLTEYQRRFPDTQFTWIQQAASFEIGAEFLAGLPKAVRVKVSLEVIAGPNRGQSFCFEHRDTFIVGRGSTAHLKLPPKDRFFSRQHFRLEIDPPQCQLTNLSKTNGTFVNGRRVNVMDLKDGDVIMCGDTAMRIAIEVMEEGDALSSVISLVVADPRTGKPHEATDQNVRDGSR